MHKPLIHTNSRADMKHELFYASGNLLHENYSIICFYHNSSSSSPESVKMLFSLTHWVTAFTSSSAHEIFS